MLVRVVLVKQWSGGGIRQIWGNFLSRLSAESDRLLYPNLEQRSHLFITSST